MELEQRATWVNETVAFLAIASIRGVGFWSMYKIFQSGIGFKKLLKSDTPLGLEEYLRTNVSDQGEPWAAAQERLWAIGVSTVRTLKNQGIRLVFRGHPDFPENLNDLESGPNWLFVQGDSAKLNNLIISVVGARQATSEGLFLTKLAIAALATEGVTTVSGLATGIDQCVHLESIRFGLPTIAVLGTGILNNYPAGSEKIRTQIIDNGGVIVSEYLPNQSYSAENFVRRNRIQAALCKSLVPIQWNIKSGTAHTVGFAYKYGKKIANIYLPSTYQERKEIEYADLTKGAVSFLVPQDISSFVRYVISDEKVTGTIPPVAGKVRQQGILF